eukprot:Clim_evm32s251 gene=Clim_evmTU32s251
MNRVWILGRKSVPPSFYSTLCRARHSYGSSLRLGSIGVSAPFTTTSHQYASEDGKIQLKIGSISTLLENIAHQYTQLPRILMEYVDNSFDSYVPVTDGRKKEIMVELPSKDSFRVYDNGVGMNKDELDAVMMNIGKSGKRGDAAFSGRFGFGIHAFRACAKKLTIISSRDGFENAYGLSVEQKSDLAEEVKKIPLWAKQHFRNKGAGTVVEVKGIHRTYRSNLKIHILAREMDRHFERILALSGVNLHLLDENKVVTCKGHDYDKYVGDIVPVPDLNELSVLLEREGEHHEERQRTDVVPEYCVPTMYLKISRKESWVHRLRFFTRGRRIAEVASVRSLMAKSKYGPTVWNHPQICGYIETGDLLQPVLTRNDYRNTVLRKKVYDVILSMEDDLKAKLDGMLLASYDMTMERMSQIMATTFGNVDVLLKRRSTRQRKFYERLNSELEDIVVEKADSGTSDKHLRDEGLPEKMPKASEPRSVHGEQETQLPKQLPLEIRVADLTVEGEDPLLSKRSRREGGLLLINSEHPDFMERVQQRMGRKRIGPRMVSYIATILANHWVQMRNEGKLPQTHADPANPDLSPSAMSVEDCIAAHALIEDRLLKGLRQARTNLGNDLEFFDESYTSPRDPSEVIDEVEQA